MFVHDVQLNGVLRVRFRSRRLCYRCLTGTRTSLGNFNWWTGIEVR